jgi:glycosyltransferase involved in cell wall biosynthesis
VALGAPAERTVVFPWGVDLKHFSPGDGTALRRRLGWENAFVLLSTRSWKPGYGVETLITAFVRLATQVSSLRLLILGSGSQGPRLRKLLARAGLLERVHFAGSVGLEDLPAYYRAADLYLTASRSDGSSVSLLEAMACGLPALVSDIPGNREWVSSEENGWRFAVDRPDALAEILGTAIAAGERLPKMGLRSRSITEARADWERNFPRLLDAYYMAADARGAR